jgi:hypothetical protein
MISKEQIQAITPAADKGWHYLLAGLMWSGVGVMLCSLAFGWLTPVDFGEVVWRVLAGLALAAVIYRFGFSKLADKNIDRIGDHEKEKLCIFAFQKWTSYPLVAVMVAMGIGLRKYSPIPKPWLAILYIGLGASLFASGCHYFVKLARNRTDKS